MKTKKKGFTFVELVVVLAVVALLGAVLIPSLINHIQTAAEEKETTEMNYFTSAVRMSLSNYEALDEIEAAAHENADDEPIIITFAPDENNRMYASNAMVEEVLLAESMPHVFSKLNSLSIDFVEITSVAHKGVNFYVEVSNAKGHSDGSINVVGYWGDKDDEPSVIPSGPIVANNDNPETPTMTTAAQIEEYLCNNLFYEAHNQGSLGGDVGDLVRVPHSALKADASLVTVNITVTYGGTTLGSGSANTGVPNSTLFLKVGDQYIGLAKIPNHASNPTTLSVSLTDRAYEAFIAAVLVNAND